MNDVWLWQGSQWTQLAGTINAGNIPGVSGINGVPQASNRPNGMISPAADFLGNSDLLYVFGGQVGGAGYMNDVWAFNMTSLYWTRIKNYPSPYSPTFAFPGGRSLHGFQNVPNTDLFIMVGVAINNIFSSTDEWAGIN